MTTIIFDNKKYDLNALVRLHKTSNINTLKMYVLANEEMLLKKRERSYIVFSNKTDKGYGLMTAINKQNGNCLNWCN